MTTILDVRRIDGTMFYRMWDTVSDAYCTEPMTRDEFLSCFPSYDRKRVEFAESHGCDICVNLNGLDGPWVKEWDQ